MTLDTHIISPQKPPIGSVIWMHGLGAHNRDFDSLIPTIVGGEQLPLRFIFPAAPVRPVTINSGMPMPAWYDVYSLGNLDREDKTGICLSEVAISQLIENEKQQGVPMDRIVLAGFSQGGAMALHTGMRQTEKLAGILALSCYLPLLSDHNSTMHTANQNTPIFMAHGTFDPTLPYFLGKISYDIIHRTHPHAQWHEYAMRHEISPHEVTDIRKWLMGVYGV